MEAAFKADLLLNTAKVPHKYASDGKRMSVLVAIVKAQY